MIAFSRLISAVSEHVTGKFIGCESIKTPVKLMLAEPEHAPEADGIYIIEGRDTEALFAAGARPDNISIFAANAGDCDIKEYEKHLYRRNINLVLTDMSVSALHNALSAIVTMQNSFDIMLECSQSGSREEDKFIQFVLDMLDLPAVLTDADGNVLFTAGKLGASFGEKRFEPGIKDRKYAEFLGRELPYMGSFKTGGGKSVYAYKLYEKQHLVGMLFAFPEADEEDFSIRFRCVGEYVRTSLVAYDSSLFDYMNSLGKLIREIMSNQITDPDRMEARFFSLDYPVDDFFNTIVIEFDQMRRSIPNKYLIKRLGQLFPKQNIGRYENKLIILFSTDKFAIKPDIDYARFSDLLKSFDAYAGIANCVSSRQNIKMSYLFACQTIKTARVFAQDPQEHIFFQTDYMTYLAFDICNKAFETCYGNDNTCYLASPGIVALVEHDKKTGDDLTKTLRIYLQNECHVSQTAAALHMHRNTLTAKLKKICEVLGDELNNGEKIFQYNLSFRLLEFYEKIQEQGTVKQLLFGSNG